MVWYNAGSGGGSNIDYTTQIAAIDDKLASILDNMDEAQFAKTITIDGLGLNSSTPKIIVPFGVDPSLGWVINVVGYAGQITHAQLDASGDVEVIAHNNTNTFLPAATAAVTVAKS